MEYLQLFEDTNLPAVKHFAPFKAVIAIEDVSSHARQIEISNWLVETGCRYVMVCGADCRSWEESIRRANLDQVDINEMEPRDFVMITTHRHEKLRSVFWHAKKHALHTHVKFENILTIHLGQQNRSVEYLAIFDKA